MGAIGIDRESRGKKCESRFLVLVKHGEKKLIANDNELALAA
jgi:hypothetical protein